MMSLIDGQRFITLLMFKFICSVSTLNRTLQLEHQTSAFINLSSTAQSSVCKLGLLEKVDTYSFVGTVNAKSFDISSRDAVRFYYVTPVYVELCSILLDTASCSLPPVNDTCYCFYRSDSVYKIMVQHPAEVALSSAKMYMYLPPSTDRQGHYEVVQEYLPAIFGQQELRLTVNDREVSLVGSSCEFLVVKSTTTIIQWCVTKLLTHKLTIRRDGLLLLSSAGECLNYSIVLGDGKLNHWLELEFRETAGCERHGTYRCRMQVTQLMLTWYGPVKSSTACKKNLVQDVDSITLKGTVMASSDEFEARPLLAFQREDRKHEFSYIDVCVVNLSYNKCNEGRQGRCYCLHQNRTTCIVVMNITAKTSSSVTRYSLRWPSPANKTSDSSAPFTTPVILNAIDAFAKKDVTLLLDNEETDLNNCFLHLKEGTRYSFKLCVFNARDPILKISFNVSSPMEYTFDQPCGMKEIKVHRGHLKSRFRFSFSEGASGCDVKQTYFCEVLDYALPTIRVGPTLLAPDIHQCSFHLLPEVTYNIQWCMGASLIHTLTIYHGSRHLLTSTDECATSKLRVTFKEEGKCLYFKYFGAETGHSVKYVCNYSTSHVVLYDGERVKSMTHCSDGLVELKDRVVLRAGLYATQHQVNARPHLVFQTRAVNSYEDFVNTCVINLALHRCLPKSSLPCYCEEANGTYFNLVLNMTAVTNLSANHVRLLWLGTASTHEVSDLKTLPVIHSLAVMETKNITLRLDGELTSPEHCSLRLEPGSSYEFEFCIFNSTNPLIRIDFGDREERTVFESSCGMKTFHMAVADYGRDLAFSVLDGEAGCRLHETFVCTAVGKDPRTMTLLQISSYVGLGICFPLFAVLAFCILSKRDDLDINYDDFKFDSRRSKEVGGDVRRALKTNDSEV